MKMDYVPVIDAAAKKQKASDYRLSLMVGYKNPSALCDVRHGRKGMSAARYAALLKLAGKALAIASLTISAVLPFQSNDANAATNKEDANKHCILC